ncbi:MAG: hypothetical protein ACFE9L_12070 [Candidatus Hodarchaeota archaeon]
MSKLAFLKEDNANYLVTIGSIILCVVGILLSASSYSSGLFSNYYELTEIEGIILIMSLVFVVILNIGGLVLKLRKDRPAQKYPR